MSRIIEFTPTAAERTELAAVLEKHPGVFQDEEHILRVALELFTADLTRKVEEAERASE